MAQICCKGSSKCGTFAGGQVGALFGTVICMGEPPRPSRIILASSSPRRRELMSRSGYDFQVVQPPMAEPDSACKGLPPARQAEALAHFKARAVADRFPHAYVLGADTVVAVGDEVLGKPAGISEARSTLRSLSGTRHSVITGMALLGPNSERIIAAETTYVTMREMTAEQIEEYLDSGEWAGKAGAYAIQETADRFVESVEGSFTNVVGLPMELLARMTKELQEHPIAHARG